jgi:hypothetical protein
MLTEPASSRLFSCFDDEETADQRATDHVASTRGILWVLRWAAAMAVLFVSGSVLAEFAYCVAAEHTVARAARAGALEATLPRATTKSITESVARRLASFPDAAGQTRLAIQRNGRPILGPMIVQAGDRISVHVTVPSNAVLPRWLRAVKFWHGSAPIEVRAERDVPGRMIGNVRGRTIDLQNG